MSDGIVVKPHLACRVGTCLGRHNTQSLARPWAGGKQETKQVEELVELDAETGVVQWPVPTVDLRYLDNDNLVLSV